jgi:hypothetical protein
VWRAESRGQGKPTKVPYMAADPRRRASSTDARSWGCFDDACDALSCPTLRLDGIGYVLTVEDGIVCVDLDHVIDAQGQLDPLAAQIVAHCQSWTEISPSGTGLHIFVEGNIPAAIRGHQIEVYAEARYIAITGVQWPGTPDDIQPAQVSLDRLVARVLADRLPRRPWTGQVVPPPDDLAGALLAKLEQWGLPAHRVKRWQDGYLVELEACPWASEHTSGPGGAAVMIRASGAFDFVCLHAHCADRGWRDFRAAMESAR